MFGCHVAGNRTALKYLDCGGNSERNLCCAHDQPRIYQMLVDNKKVMWLPRSTNLDQGLENRADDFKWELSEVRRQKSKL